MEYLDSRGCDFDVDLESGGTTSEEDGIRDPSSNEKHVNQLLGRSWSGLVGLEQSVSDGEGSGSYNKVLNSVDVLVENAEIMSNKMGPELVNLGNKKMAKETRKKTNSKAPSKPPRPPRGPCLGAADIKLVREFSELAALKQKRVERMKSLRKPKAEKASSLNSNLFALVVTILFCFVIVFQGLLGSRI